MRLIDADALVAEIIDLGAKIAVPDKTGVIDDLVHAACEMCADALDVIKEQPTINSDDLRPQGRWITERCNHVQHRFKNPEKWVIHKCSLCGYSNGRKQSNYCPNCGAKMDGKENENGIH